MNYKELRKLIEDDGWYLESITGGHHQFKHPIKQGKITIPYRDITKNIELSVMRQAGIKRQSKKITKKSRKNPHPKDDFAPISQIYVCPICGNFNKTKNKLGCTHPKSKKPTLCYERSLILSEDKTKVIKAMAVRKNNGKRYCRN